MDALSLGISMLFFVAGWSCVLLSLRAVAVREAGQGEYLSLLLGSIAGMVVLAQAESLITLFVGLELLSIPLYVLCATELRRGPRSSRGSSTWSSARSARPRCSTGSRSSTAPPARWSSPASRPRSAGRAARHRSAAAHRHRAHRHRASRSRRRWRRSTSGRPTSTRAPPPRSRPSWPWPPRPPRSRSSCACSTTRSASRSSSGRRRWRRSPRRRSSSATSGRSRSARSSGCSPGRAWRRRATCSPAWWWAASSGVRATAFYLAAYLLMNVAAFAVVIARERVSEHGDDLASLENLGRAQPWLAWPMTIAMLSLAGFPATGGFIGKFYLIDASVAGDYAWLGIVIVIGSVISLVYYLRVVAVMWMGGYEVELPTLPPPPRQAGGGLVARGRRAGPARGRRRGDRVRRRDDLLRHLAGPAVRRGARRGHLAVGAGLAAHGTRRPLGPLEAVARRRGPTSPRSRCHISRATFGWRAAMSRRSRGSARRSYSSRQPLSFRTTSAKRSSRMNEKSP